MLERQIQNIHGMREIITCYIDSLLGGSGYQDLKMCKDHSPADRDIFEGISRICAQLESYIRFSDTLEYLRKSGVSRDAFQVVLDQLLIGELNWAFKSHLNVHTELPIICVQRSRLGVHTELPIVCVRGSLRSPI